MYRAMVGVGLMCGVLIVSVYQWTPPVIERTKRSCVSYGRLVEMPFG